ncbi:MAG: helix-turn-helix domain-containing protein [Streptosporangiaceae bacterium]
MVLELSGTRSEAAAAFSAETAAVVGSSLGGAIPEMIEAIGRAVPEYASPDAVGPDAVGPDAVGRARPGYQQRLADAVTGAVASFIAHVAQPDRSMEPVLEEFRVIGGTAAREGRTLDGLQDALRLGARVAWRWLCEAGAGLDRRELSRVGEAVFGYLDELAAACARGYAEARAQTVGDHQRHLLELILADPPPHPGQLTAAARAAHWLLPTQVALAVVGPGPDTPLLPPGVLVDWTAADPCLLIPDPDGPGRQAAVDRALRGRPAAIGPSVPLAQAAQSLRWARHARSLAQSGVILGACAPAGSGSSVTGPAASDPAASGPIRCDQHLSTLLILADEALAAALSRRRLAPLDGLRPTQRDRIAETLLAWLQLGENAAEVAQRIHVHPQTVRYRLRQIQDLFGDQLRDPDCRFELQLALRIRALTPHRPRPAPS